MYFCALRPTGEALQKADLFGHIARLRDEDGGAYRSVVNGPFAAIVREHPGRRSMLSHSRTMVAAGDVRLDNRGEIMRLTNRSLPAQASDLDVVMAAIDEVGESCIERIIGDYAFVLWDARAQKLLAVRDAFGVKPLYHRVTNELVLFSSRTEPLHPGDELDHDYMADFILGMNTGGTRTIWADVQSIRPGSMTRYRGTTPSTTAFWSALDLAPVPSGDEREDVERFGSLFREAVRVRTANESGVWSHLSGGLDSSSIVSVASNMSDEGVALDGTVTLVDTMGEGDERVFSDTVATTFGLRNEQVTDFWAWQDHENTPLTDEPTVMLPFHARDQRLRDAVRAAGGRILLSGTGADHYLHGSLDYISDMAAAGHVRSALREVLAWAVQERQSFWKLTHRELIRPLLPFQRSPAVSPASPDWIQSSFAERCALASMPGRGAPGHRFERSTAAAISTLPSVFERWPGGGDIEMRYPFLYRPLVEFALRLPARERIRPEGRKWILREAMRGIVPEPVRTRASKGGIDQRILWSLSQERAHLDAMLTDPVLADLGCIEPQRLRDAVGAASRGVPVNIVTLFSTLSLETWLSARAGRSNVRTKAAQSAA